MSEIKKENKKESICDELFNSKSFVLSLVICAFCVLLIIVFKLGMCVGFEKAKFSYKWADNYYKNFTEPRGHRPITGFNPFEQRQDDFINAHGIIGKIISIEENSIIIKSDKEDFEKIILIDSETSIKKMRETLTISDLNTDDEVICFGKPDTDGFIKAVLIRVTPKLK